MASEDVASDLGHDGIRAEHILMAVHAQADGSAARLLAGHHASLPDLTRAVRDLASAAAPGLAREPDAHVMFTAGAQEAMITARAIAHGAGSTAVSPAHLALAAIRPPGTTVRAVLDRLGADVDALDSDLRQLVESRVEPSADERASRAGQ